jgi:hypothetical protein
MPVPRVDPGSRHNMQGNSGGREKSSPTGAAVESKAVDVGSSYAQAWQRRPSAEMIRLRQVTA